VVGTTARERIMAKYAWLGGLLASAFAASFLVFTYGPGLFKGAPPGDPPGMVWVPGGEFTMGSDDPDALAPEHPAHRVRVDGFWMDETDVTNAQLGTTAEKNDHLGQWRCVVDQRSVSGTCRF